MGRLAIVSAGGNAGPCDRHAAGSAGLLAAIAWECGSDRISMLMVWKTAAARGDFSFERMMPLLQSDEFADVTDQPERVTAVEVYLRPR